MSYLSNTLTNPAHNENSIAYATLILRLTLGIMFLAHALLKIMVFTLPGTMEFFAAVGFPGWLVYPTVVLEIIGGILLVLGLGTRWVTLALLPVLLGAVLAHLGNGWVFSYPNGGWEYPAFLAVATVVQTLLGSGPYTVRLLLGNRHTATT